MQTSTIRFLPLVLAAFTLISACGDGDKSAPIDASDSILRHVPADTPYVFATTGDAPDALLDKLRPHIDTSLAAYQLILRSTIEADYTDARSGNQDVEWLENVRPLLDELDSLMSVDGLAAAGIDRNSQFAMYGAGLLPVIRVELSDSALMEAELGRLEEKAGYAMDTAELDGQRYRYAGDTDTRVVLAIVADELVLTFVPNQLSDEEFKRVLGLTAPQQNMAENGALLAVVDEYDFDQYAAGFVDLERIASTFVTPQTGVNAELLAMMEHDPAELSQVCVDEITALSGVMPRIVMGYSELSTDAIDGRAILELRDDIAAAVSGLSASVPGLGTPQSGLLSFGMGVDLLALRNFYSDRLDAIEAEPFECPQLGDFQDGIVAGRAMLNQPIPPIAYSFKGFLAAVQSVDGLDIAAQQPPTSVEMQLLIATENAEGLLAMGAMFSPQLAALSIEPDGEPVRLSLPQVDATGQIVHIALSDEALAISVGEGMEDGLTALLASEASASQPFIYSEMDAGTYYEFVNGSMTTDVDGLGEIEGVLEAIEQMNQSSSALMERVSFSVNFTNRGIEIESDLTLKD